MAQIRKKRAPLKKKKPPAKSIAQKLRSKSGTRETSKQLGKKSAPIATRAEVIGHFPVADEPLGEAGVSYGLTLALPRKYEFARIDVHIKIPCGIAQLDEAYAYAREKAQEKIREEVAEVRAMFKPSDEDTDSSL